MSISNKIEYKSVKSGSSAKCMDSTVKAIKQELKLMQD